MSICCVLAAYLSEVTAFFEWQVNVLFVLFSRAYIHESIIDGCWCHQKALNE